MQEHKQASAWFEGLYKKFENQHDNIPWARLEVNPYLTSYLEKNKTKHQKKALVIGCGLGDDAYALFKAGYEVLAIDISQTALKIAQKRFPNTTICFEKQDIFDMPKKYHQHFDFVFESLTIQSLPREFRAKMIHSIINTLLADAEILVIAHKFNGNTNGPPWPLTQEEITIFNDYGMKELSFEVIQESSQISNDKFRALYQNKL